MTPIVIGRSHRLRRVLSLVLALAIIGLVSWLGVRTFQSSHADSAPSIYLNPGSANLAAGATVSMTIRENSGSQGINTVQASLAYDSNHLQFSGLSESGVFPVKAATVTNQPGIIRLGRAVTNGTVSGDNAVATVNFTVIGTAGTAVVSLDKSYSLLVRATDSSDILQSVGSASYAVAGSSSATTPAPVAVPSPTPTPTTSPTPSPTPSQPVAAAGSTKLTLDPSAGTVAANTSFDVAVQLTSGAAAITTIEPVISYPADKLQYVGVKEGGTFSTQQRTRNNAGTIDIIRGVAGGSGGVTGTNNVVTLTFKALAGSGNAVLGFTAASAAYDNSGTGASLLDLSGSAGASYSLVGAGAASTVGSTTTSGTGQAAAIVTPSQALSITAIGGSRVAVVTAADGQTVAEVSGQFDLAPVVANASQLTDGSITKVEYYLNGKLLATEKSAPYTYKFNTAGLKNGSYAVGVKTYYSNGTADSRTDKIAVKNKVTLAYVVRNYAPNIAVLLAILVITVIFMFKLVIPRLNRRQAVLATAGSDGVADLDLMAAGNIQPTATNTPVAADPTVIAPAGQALAAAPTAEMPAVVIEPPTVAQPATTVAPQPAAATVFQPSIQPVVAAPAAPRPVDGIIRPTSPLN